MIYQNPKESKKTQKFQEGGAVQPTTGNSAPTPEEGGDPITELVTLAQQAIESQNCEAAMAVCQGFMMLVTQSAPSETAPPTTGEPVYKKGGTLLRRQ